MKTRRFSIFVIASCLFVSLGAFQMPAGSAGSRVVAHRLNIGTLNQLKGDLSSVACSSTGECQVVGAYAVPNPKHSIMAVLRTRDGGATWVQEALPQRSGELNDVTCVFASTCWTVGSTGGFTIPRIFRTTDGGARWSLQAVGLRGEPMAVSCGSTNICVAGGVLSKPKATRDLAPLVTHDAGHVWTASNSAAWMAGTNGVSCPSSLVCEVVGSWVSSMSSSETVGRSDNGGRSWIEQRPDVRAFNTSLNSISCSSTLVCEAVGAESGCSYLPNCPPSLNVPAGGLALHSSDGGAHWIRQGLPKTVRLLQHVWCASSMDCQAVGLSSTRHAVAVRTTDGGSTWSLGRMPSQVGFLSSVSCQNKTKCIAVGFSGESWPHLTIKVIRTTDGGVSWTS